MLSMLTGLHKKLQKSTSTEGHKMCPCKHYGFLGLGAVNFLVASGLSRINWGLNADVWFHLLLKTIYSIALYHFGNF